jgi:hypothetical protein
MDFTWVTTDDANAIQNSIVDAKGDLIAASANDTPARLAVGNNGETLVADSSTSTGLRYQGNYAAGKNKVINGAFDIWQRGTSFNTVNIFTSDRWFWSPNAGVTPAISRQTFTPGTEIEGSQYFYRVNVATKGGLIFAYAVNKIENVATLAGQTVTLSLWAKAETNGRTINLALSQTFGTGGSSAVTTSSSAITLTTSWARYSVTLALPSISGKTIGANNCLELVIQQNFVADNQTFDFSNVQLEAGSVATAFQTATGTLQGELAACRYYFRRYGGNAIYENFGTGQAYAAGSVLLPFVFDTPMRATPVGSYSAASNFRLTSATYSGVTPTTISTNLMTRGSCSIVITGASGLVAGNASTLEGNNGTSSTIDFSAEL